MSAFDGGGAVSASSASCVPTSKTIFEILVESTVVHIDGGFNLGFTTNSEQQLIAFDDELSCARLLSLSFLFVVGEIPRPLQTGSWRRFLCLVRLQCCEPVRQEDVVAAILSCEIGGYKVSLGDPAMPCGMWLRIALADPLFVPVKSLF